MSTKQTHVVISGASGGIGMALSRELAQRGLHVLGLGRDEERLAACRALNPAQITTLAVDLTLPSERNRVCDAVRACGGARYLVHAAAILEPVARACDLSLEDFQRAHAINVEAPLFMSLELRSFLRGGRILQLSSGAAHEPVAGCLTYCATKAALHMIYRVLSLELREQGIAVGSASPGAADTDMQAKLRRAPAEVLPSTDRFRALADEGKLVTPERSARFLAWLLLDATDAVFCAQDWTIRDESLLPLWQPETGDSDAH